MRVDCIGICIYPYLLFPLLHASGSIRHTLRLLLTPLFDTTDPFTHARPVTSFNDGKSSLVINILPALRSNLLRGDA